jgi:hypothetical protein
VWSLSNWEIRVAGRVALGFESELHGDWVGVRAEEIVAYSIASPVAPGAGDIDLVYLRLADAPQIGGELFKVVRPVFRDAQAP